MSIPHESGLESFTLYVHLKVHHTPFLAHFECGTLCLHCHCIRDDTVFPTTSVVCKKEQHITVGQLQTLGKSVYDLFGKYIRTFGANNVFIVTNGSHNWVLDSLREMSRVYQVSFDGVDDQEERRKDYWAALYNSLLSLQLKIVSAKALYAEVCTVTLSSDFVSIHDSASSI